MCPLWLSTRCPVESQATGPTASQAGTGAKEPPRAACNETSHRRRRVQPPMSVAVSRLSNDMPCLLQYAPRPTCPRAEAVKKLQDSKTHQDRTKDLAFGRSSWKVRVAPLLRVSGPWSCRECLVHFLSWLFSTVSCLSSHREQRPLTSVHFANANDEISLYQNRTRWAKMPDRRQSAENRSTTEVRYQGSLHQRNTYDATPSLTITHREPCQEPPSKHTHRAVGSLTSRKSKVETHHMSLTRPQKETTPVRLVQGVVVIGSQW